MGAGEFRIRKPKGISSIGHESEPEDSATIAVKMLASSYGFGQAWMTEVVRTASTKESSFDTDDQTDGSLESINVLKRSWTINKASKAINKNDAEQRSLMKSADKHTLSEAEKWSRTNSLRPKAGKDPNHLSEFESWKISGSATFLPINAGGGRAVRALCRARLDGPVCHALLFAATHDKRHWRVVLWFLMACGHPEWACDEIFREFFGRGRTIKAGAKYAGVRAQKWANEVRRARNRLDEWIARGGHSVVDKFHEKGVLISGYVFLVSGPAPLMDRGVPACRAKDPISYNTGDSSGMRSESWWRPRPTPPAGGD